MRLRLPLWVLFALASGFAQTVVPPNQVADLLKRFNVAEGNPQLVCRVTPIAPALDFSFRFRAQYRIQAPIKQYVGPGHQWTVLLRISPEGGDRQPVYLVNTHALPDVPGHVNEEGEVLGGFLLGEGRYRAKSMVLDDEGRVCASEWRIEARLGRAERYVVAAMAPGTVDQLSLPRPPDRPRDERPVFERLTILLHATPASFRDSVFQPSDVGLLLGSLASLVEQLPARTVRLVAFNLEQRKEFLRQEDFTEGGLVAVGQALGDLKLGLVDYHLLQNPQGHLDLLSGLINRELNEKPLSDCVIFFGPQSRFLDKLPREALNGPDGHAPKFFYLQYTRFTIRVARARERRSGSIGPPFGYSTDTADSVTSAVRDLGGKTLVIRSPADLAGAIQQIRQTAAVRAVLRSVR